MPDRDRGEDTGDAELLRREVGEVAAEQRDRHLDRGGRRCGAGRRRSTPPTPIPTAIPPTTLRTKSPLASIRLNEPGQDGRDGELVGDERGAVVDQRLALDDRHDPSGNVEPAGDRRGRDRVGRGDDRSEHERLRPAEVERLVGDDRDDDHRRQHEADREQRDRAHVAPKLAQRGEVGRRVEQRRQEDDEDELRLQLDVGERRGERRARARRSRAGSGRGSAVNCAATSSATTASRMTVRARSVLHEPAVLRGPLDRRRRGAGR